MRNNQFKPVLLRLLVAFLVGIKFLFERINYAVIQGQVFILESYGYFKVPPAVFAAVQDGGFSLYTDNVALILQLFEERIMVLFP